MTDAAPAVEPDPEDPHGFLLGDDDQPPDLTVAIPHALGVSPGALASADTMPVEQAEHIVAEVAHLYGPDAPEYEPGEGPWRITSEGAASWALAKWHTAGAEIAAAEADRVAVHRRAQALMDRADDLFSRATADAVLTSGFMRGHLEAWARQVRAASPLDRNGEPTVKTIGLPAGDLATRGYEPSVTIADKDALVAWAKAHAPELVKPTYSVPAARLAEVVEIRDGQAVLARPIVDQDTGEIVDTTHVPIDGVEVRPGWVKVTPKPDTGVVG